MTGGECATCVDIDWLLTCGETLDTTAARLHMQRGSLVKHARGHGLDIERAIAWDRLMQDAASAHTNRNHH